MRKKKKSPLPLFKKPQGFLQSFYFNPFFERFHVHLGDPEELNGHHPQILEGPSGSGKDFFFGLFFAKGEMKILKGYLPTFPIKMKEDVSQLLPAPKGKTLRQKVDKEADPFQQQILKITNQSLSFLNSKSQTPCLPAGR
jgi:hypothetical protein